MASVARNIPDGNPRFLQYVLEAGADANIPVPLLDGFKQAMEQAIGADIATAARAAEEFVRRNETLPPAYTENIEGLRMQESQQAQDLPASVSSPNGELDVLWVGLPLVGRCLRRSLLVGQPHPPIVGKTRSLTRRYT